MQRLIVPQQRMDGREGLTVRLVRSKRYPRTALVALLAVIAMLGSPGVAHGAVEVNERIDLEGAVFEDLCGEDLLHTGGQLHILFSFTMNDNHISGSVHFQPQGAKLIGLTSGAEYVGTGMSHQTFTEALDGGVATFTSVDNFRIIGKGQAPSFFAQAVVHATINANGDVTAEVELASERCR